ncbi:hypothetical protein C2869_08670 [Saccharobesus litoralis]|uniref:DUF2970 domain-containing protein n=1 Tax=Saccharobesus litoralis TaxID=2172099 RepID=A0A2S0VQJ8_9ALTE|nr:DUF2970 domain-containing protein [Saccharobesus litoralis]AWB66496.1 hypothetical protein C2869_08670 [Saccharobesus litoralis]
MWLRAVKAVLSALFGVQSDKNRQSDFAKGSLPHILIIGIMCIGLLIIALVLAVSLVLN